MANDNEKRSSNRSVSSERTIEAPATPTGVVKKEGPDGDRKGKEAVGAEGAEGGDDVRDLPPDGEDDFPDGGLRAWLVVLGVGVHHLSC